MGVRFWILACVALVFVGCAPSHSVVDSGNNGNNTTSGGGTTSPPPSDGGGGTKTPPPPQPPSPAPSVTFSEISQQILQPKCVSCHSYFSTYTGTMTRVSRGKPMSSPFYTRCVDGSMPKGRAALTAAQLNMISDWITAGAPNN